MNQKLLSVIIPAYNSENEISRCLKSICNQTYKNLQIIIIDDGSSDSTFNICEGYKKNDKRIELYKKENQGVSAARNEGLKKTKGEYISFVDSDDFLENNAFEVAINQIKNVDSVFFGYIEHYNTTSKRKVIKPNKHGIVDVTEAIKNCITPCNYDVSIWNKIFKAEKIKSIYFNTETLLSEDEEWLFKVFERIEKIYLIPTPLYNYVQTKNSITRSESISEETIISGIKAKKEIEKLLVEKKCHVDLYRAKIFDDIFRLSWNLYINNKKQGFAKIQELISQYRTPFYKSENYSKKKKIKYKIMEYATQHNFSRGIVRLLKMTTTFNISYIIKTI